MERKVYNIMPVPKPRMTRRDKWKQRPAVLAYHAFKDLVRLHGVTLPVPYKVTFNLPMPTSWSKKKRAKMNGAPHMQRPDKDNLEKALLDAVYQEDAHIWSGWSEKRWSEIPSIVIEPIGEQI